MDKPVDTDDGRAIIRLDGGAFDRFVSGSADAFTRLVVETGDPESVLERAEAKGYHVTESQFTFCGVHIVVTAR